MKRHLFLFLAFGLSFHAACNGRGETSSNGSEKIMNVNTHLTTNNTVLDVVNHPAFKGFGERLLSRDNNASYYSTRLNYIGQLMPYHGYVDPDTVIGALNYLIDEANGDKTIFYDFYTEAQKRNDPAKEYTGLFFFRGKPGAPFAVVCPGGGFSYVGSLHEGLPLAQEICKKGLNAFVIRYRIGGEQRATEDLAAALSYIFENAETLEVSTKDYSLWGGSAGARMAGNIALSGVSAYGGGNLPKPSTAVIAYTGQSSYSDNFPPAFFVQSENDGIANVSVVDRRVENLRAAGVEVEYRRYRSAGHGFGLGIGTDAEGWIDYAIRFWEKHITAYGGFQESLPPMVPVEGGTFTMGSPAAEKMRGSNEGPQHEASVSNFYLGKYEVTQKEWTAVMGTNPSTHKGDNLPVENITWYEAVRYCNERSVKEGLTPAYTINGNAVSWNRAANGYRLPTEAEWEYAAKGGNKDKVTFLYAGSNNADTVGWHNGNSTESKPIGSKAPNSLGFYDMSGNVGEMCWDFHGNYSRERQTDPTGAVTGGYHVGRGGCWYYDVQYLRTSFRAYIDPATRYHMVGFRLARNG